MTTTGRMARRSAALSRAGALAGHQARLFAVMLEIGGAWVGSPSGELRPPEERYARPNTRRICAMEASERVLS